MNNIVTFDIMPLGKKSNKAKVQAFQDEKLIEVDTINLESRRSRTGFLSSIASKTGIDKEKLDKVFIEQIENIKTIAEDKAKDAEVNPLENCPQEQINQALEMLKNPDLFNIINQDIEKIGIAGESELCRQLYIIMSSRILDKPLAGIVFGASASGKSYLIETISKMMPVESVLQAHDITDEALYYLPEGSLENKVVIAGERLEDKRGRKGKAEDNTKALREVLASGKLSKLVTTKDSDGQPVSRLIEQQGPIVYLESTTSTGIHDEDATRLLPLVTDESIGQTQTIIEAMRKKALGQSVEGGLKEEVLSKHQTAQRLLKPCKVIIPYASLLKLPCDVVSTRRAFDQLLSMIKAVATLRQYQKQPLNSDSDCLTIEADITDYAIVYPIVLKIFSRTYSPINQKSLDLLLLIIEKDVNTFTIPNLIDWAGISDASIRRRLNELVTRGVLSLNKEQRPFQFKLENPELAQTADIGLISPEEINQQSEIERISA